MKKKLDLETKAKLIYSGELMLFAVIFLVIAILKATKVIDTNPTRATIFNWITLFGGTWIIADFCWALFDKKRQKRIALIDKIIHAPAGIYLVSFDLYCLIAKPADTRVYQFGIPIVLGYLCLCYAFEAVYHFYHPIPGLLDAIEEANKQEVVAEQQAEFVEDNKEENKEENKDEQ